MAVFFGLILAIGITGWLYLKANRSQIRESAEHELRSIAELKAAQIAQWQSERLADARVIAENALLAEDIAAWRSDPGNRDLERGLRQWLESVQRNYRYQAVHLLAPQGGVLMAALAPGGVFVESDRQQALRCLTERTTILSDLYRDPGLQAVHQELCVPIMGSTITAIVVLQIDPDLFLYPMIRTWPTFSRSAESLLVRRDGDQVLFLNELRHRKDSALNLRIPADAPLLPAALAVRGMTGTVEGIDYRGVPVIASVLPVPDSNWFIVCKVDKEEIYQPFHRVLWLTGLAMLALILLSATGTHRLWRHQRDQWLAERRQDLEMSERRYRALFEGMTEGFALHEILCDTDGTPRDYRFLEINPAFERITGLRREAVVGRTVLEVLPGTESYWIEAYGRVALTGEAVHFDQFHAELGRHFDVFAYRPAPEQFAVLFMDITARKRVEEELRRSNENLEQFAYVASHDLQEPLRMMSSYSQLLERRYQGKLDADADVFIGFITDGAQRMQTLISDLLAYSRVGRRDQPSVRVDMTVALGRALGALAPAVEAADARITHDPLPAVLGPESLIVQLFQNLIGNAVKFRGPDPPRIHIGAARGTGEWVFSVRDNGIGIAPQYRDRIFLIFQRLHGRDQYPGTGIGLSLCKKIVELWGGRIWVESEPGTGSTFFFTVPAAAVEETTP
jgi:PAS domain S-box-containing protein